MGFETNHDQTRSKSLVLQDQRGGEIAANPPSQGLSEKVKAGGA